MAKFKGISVDVPPEALEKTGPQIRQISASHGCLHLEYGLRGGQCRFVLAVPPPRVGAVEQALRKLGGVTVAQARTRDIQQLRQVREGQAASELDF